MQLRLLAIVTTGLLTAADDPPKGPGGPELTRAIRRGASMVSYKFKIEEGPGKGTVAVEGQYEKAKPIAFNADRIEFYSRGEVLVYKDAGRWNRTKRGIESDPLRILGASAKVRAARLPHEELAGLEKTLMDVKKAAKKEDGFTVYTGALTEDGARRLAPTEVRGVTRGGQVKLWISGGAVHRYAVTLRLKGRQGGAEIDGERTKTITLTGIDATRVKVPKEATKVLE